MMVFLVGMALLGVGFMLSFYLPFVPAIIWYGALLSLAIIYIEALVASPLWMVAHLDTSQGRGMGHRTGHGYIFLLSVVFRPTLMVFGLIAGWMLINYFGEVLKNLMALFYGSGGYAVGSPLQQMLMLIPTLFVFLYLAMMTVNRCWGLINHLPNECISWVGGHLRGLGGDDTRAAETRFAAAGVAVGQKGEGVVSDKRGELKEAEKDYKERVRKETTGEGGEPSRPGGGSGGGGGVPARGVNEQMTSEKGSENLVKKGDMQSGGVEKPAAPAAARGGGSSVRSGGGSAPKEPPQISSGRK